MVQLLDIETRDPEAVRVAAAHQQPTGRKTRFAVLVGLICMSMVLAWSAAPTARAIIARVAEKSLRPTAHTDPMIQFTSGLSSPLFSKPMSSSQPRLRAPLSMPQPATPSTHFRPATRANPKVALSAHTVDGSNWDPSMFNRKPGESEIKTFLTQRALQNLLELLLMAHDEVTANWLEAWNGHEGIRNYHGLSGLHMGGRAYLVELLRTPDEEVTVAFKRHGTNMGSKGNPYIQDQVIEFKEKIEPRRLADRLLNLREDIAEEWVKDLTLIHKENEELWRSFFEVVRENEDKLEGIQVPVYRPSDDVHQDTTFRRANYDLLRRLTTYDAAKQIRFEYQRGNKEDKIKADFLDNMLTVYGSDFEGDSGHEDVDKRFFEALLARPPSIIGGVPISPLGIVEKICEVRQTLAEKWIEEMKEIPQDHMKLQVEFLEASLTY